MLFRLDITGSSMQNETVVYFDTSGAFTYNPVNDAPSLGVDPGYLNIVTRFDSIDYQIKCLPLLIHNISIPVKAVTGVSGTYQIYASDIQNLPAGACISLHDNFLNTDQDLRLGSYTCNIADTETVARFVLNISISVVPVSGNFLNPSCSASGDGYIYATLPASTTMWNYYWKDSSNNVIKACMQKNTPDTLFGANAGAYRLDISSGGCVSGTTYFNLEGTLSPSASFTVSADTIDFSTPVIFTNNSINANSYWWDFGDGMGADDTNSSHYYASPGTYTVTLTAISLVCSDSSAYYKEITLTSETTGIKKNANEDIFISRDITGYYVKFNSPAKQGAIISVIDLVGRKIIEDLETKNTQDEKIRINIAGHENQILIISVVSTSGEMVYKKIIN
jgi:hypothetical protein